MRAISVAAQCHGLVALDRDGKVVRPAKLWNDTTSAPQMSRLIEQMPARGVGAADGLGADGGVHDLEARLVA